MKLFARRNWKRLLLILAFALAVAGCRWYLQGEIKVDETLITNENFELIADNWRKLVEAGMLTPERSSEYEEKSRFHRLRVMVKDDEGRIDYWLTVDACDWDLTQYGLEPFDARIVQAEYTRNNLIGMLREFGYYGATGDDYVNCQSIIAAESPRCRIMLKDYDSDTTSARFEALLTEMLELTGGEVGA